MPLHIHVKKVGNKQVTLKFSASIGGLSLDWRQDEFTLNEGENLMMALQANIDADMNGIERAYAIELNAKEPGTPYTAETLLPGLYKVE